MSKEELIKELKSALEKNSIPEDLSDIQEIVGQNIDDAFELGYSAGMISVAKLCLNFLEQIDEDL